ncbi:MerR family transcriptional regulator, partial [Candidatus Microgenomates bacterium]|nr:MerR family transcriptional regulator [Candidatus Microgenomates bacterium]
MSLPKVSVFSISHAAKILGVSADTLRRLEKKGKIKPFRGENQREYSFDDIALLRELLHKPPRRKTYSIQEAATLLNISIDTLRRWEREGKVKPQRTAGGHRRFTSEEIEQLKNKRYQTVQVSQPTPILPQERIRELIPFEMKLVLFVTVVVVLFAIGGGSEVVREEIEEAKKTLATLQTQVGSLRDREEGVSPDYDGEVLPAIAQGGGVIKVVPSDLNLLFNSSFEAGAINYEARGWDYILSSSLNNTTVSNESVRSGNLAVKINDSSASPSNPLSVGMYQSATTTVNGRAYVFSVNVRGTNIVGNPNLRIGFLGSVSSNDPNYGKEGFSEYAKDRFVDIPIKKTGGWETYSFTYENAALGKYPFVQVSNYQGGSLFLDDLTLYEVLESQVVASSPAETSIDADILYQSLTKIGDGSIVVEANGTLYPRQGLGIGGTLGKSDARFGVLYVSTLDVVNTVSFSGDITMGNGKFIGLGGAAGRIVFTDGAPDELDIQTANLDMNTNIITNIGNASTDFDTSGGLTLASDLAVNGGDITTSATTFNLINDTATTINFGAGATTSLTIGGSSANVVITDANWSVTGPGVASLTGLSSSGTITFSGLTADRLVATTTGGQLTNSISSANVAASVTDETGTGALVFASSPSLVTPDIGAATGTSLTLTGDIAVNGDDITSDGNLTINATGYVRIGDTTTPGSATGDDALFVEGALEVDGTLYLDGTTVTATNVTSFNCTDCIDFDDMEDTLDLDTSLTLNQTTNTWSQTFTGTTTSGFSYAANSLTGGEALDISSSATAFTGQL